MIAEDYWDKVIEKAKLSKKIIILGEVDTGKSTFARYLIKNLLLHQQPVCFIDSDIGQSSIGLPTTIALKIYSESTPPEKETDSIIIDFDRLYFVGFTTPSISPEIFMSEFTKAVEFSKSLNVKIVVDTTGFVSGEMGKRLKLEKISILQPDLVIAFERVGELRHILSEIRTEIITLTPSGNITPRSPLKRAEYRMEKFKKYFTDAESYAVSKKLLNGALSGNPEGVIIGLLQDEKCSALGVIEDIDRENIVFSSPTVDIRKIKKLKIGKLNLKSLLNDTV